MVECGVLFEVRTELISIAKTSIGFKGLNLNSVNQLIFVMVECGVLFEVRTELISIAKTSIGFKGLKNISNASENFPTRRIYLQTINEICAELGARNHE
jgi:hypothetical protein